MLQQHWGQLALPLERSRLARVLFKSPACGATTLLAAALQPRVPPKSWGEHVRWKRGWAQQPYFVNRRPGGFASAESRDLEAAMAAWEAMVRPAARRLTPAGYRMLTDGLEVEQPPA